MDELKTVPCDTADPQKVLRGGGPDGGLIPLLFALAAFLWLLKEIAA